MEDSGIECQQQQQQQRRPTVKMPASNSSKSIQDSGLCCDLLQKLSLDSGALGQNKSPLALFYEPDEDGDVQLHLAVASGMADVVDALVRMAQEASAAPDLLSMQNNQGYSPLHIAVLQNQPAFVRRLVSAGAKLDLRDGEGNTPLHLAALRGHVECAQELIRQSKCTLLDQRNNQGRHCVHLATMGGHLTFLQFLSWNGADMNALEGKSGRSSLHLAVGAKNLPLVQCLVEPQPNGCGVDPSLLDWYGRNAYQQSLMNRQAEMASYLASKTPTSNGQEFWPDEVTASDSEDDIFASSRLVSA